MHVAKAQTGANNKIEWFVSYAYANKLVDKNECV